MKFAIVGAGAIGAFLGAMLARAGEDVTLVARGPHLRAMQQHGVRVRGDVGEFQVPVTAIDDPDGSKSERCRRLADSLIKAGLRSPIRTNIRHDIWVKLMGNVAYNPISALTRATLIEIVQCAETRALAVAIMSEAESVARKLGIELGISIDQRLKGAE